MAPGSREVLITLTLMREPTDRTANRHVLVRAVGLETRDQVEVIALAASLAKMHQQA